MTLTTVVVESSDAGDGVTTAFTTGFKFFQDADLAVELIDDATGAREAQILNTDYTVTGAGDPNGGTITFTTAPPSGKTVYRRRRTAITQGADFLQNDGFDPETFEAVLDKAVAVAQESADTVGDAIRVPPDETPPGLLPALAARKGKLLGFDAVAGDPAASAATMADMDALVAAWLAGTANPEEFPAGLAATMADLRGLTPTSGAAVLLLGHQAAGDGGGGIFRWDAGSADADDNGLTILPTGHSGNGRWKRILFDAITPRMFGGTLDGVADVTAEINAAISAANALGGGTVVVDGDAHVSISSGAAITMLSNVTLLFVNDARVTLEPNDLTGYQVIRCYDISNFAIIGAHITGDKDGHTGGTGEQGHCIRVLGCTDYRIENCGLRKGWGDGIELGGSLTGGLAYSLRGRIVNVDCDANRRQGFSILSCDDLEVVDCVFRNTDGTTPGAGIDVEPFDPAHRVRGLRIRGCLFLNNTGSGFFLSLQELDDTSEAVDIVVSDCAAVGNDHNYELLAPGDATDGHLKGRVHLVHPFSELSDKNGIKLRNWDKDGLDLRVIEPVVLDPAETATLDTDKAGIRVVRSSGTDERLGNIAIVRPWIEDRRSTPKMLTCIIVQDNGGSGSSGPIRIIDPLKLEGFTGNGPMFNYEGAEVIDTFRAGVYDQNANVFLAEFRYYPVIQNASFTAARNVDIGPNLQPGTRIVFEMIGTQTIKIVPDALEQILVLTHAAGQSFDLTRTGQRLVLRKISSTEWMPEEWGADGAILESSTTYDPPSLTDGAEASTTVTVTGAALGDFVEAVSFSNNLQGLIMTAYVSAADTVTVLFHNETGGTLDLASGTVRARVRKA